MSTIIEHHAQKQQIIEDMMNNVSPAEVARKYNLNKATTYRYRETRLKPALAAINPALIGHNRAITQSNETQSEHKSNLSLGLESQRSKIATQRTSLAAQFVDKIARYDERRDKMLAVAEGKEDIRGFAAIDGRILSAIELQARLSGALQDQAAPGASIRVVIRADGAVECAASASGPAEDAGECYDIDAQPL